MIQKNKIIIASLLLTSSLFAQTGKEIFQNNCKVCHTTQMGWKLTQAQKDKMKAPPIMGVVKKIRGIFSNEKQFVKYVSRYITKPTRIQSRCKSNVIDKFGLMPPIGQNLTKEERTKVASWLFNNINVK